MKKGFTLIELLAVIIVLAVIAIIAVPLVGDVIDTGKIEATENSALFYVREIENEFSEWMIVGIPSDLSYDDSEDGYIKFYVKDLNSSLKIEGEKPIDGYIKINNNYSSDNHYFGYVIGAELVYENGYVANYTYRVDGSQSNRVKIDVNKR